MNNIIVGFDFSTGSANAVDLTIDIANRWQSDILNIKPFNLRECEAFAESKHLAMSRKNIMGAYMILGGILSR